MTINSETISSVNAKFYDQIAQIYDEVDRRRAQADETPWLMQILAKYARQLRRFSKEIRFLDAGAGSGFLSLRADPFFDHIVLLDVSKAMLDRIPLPRAEKVVGDCNAMPLPDNSFDFVGAFATLHHLFDPKVFFREAYRVLRKGGILYTDHDIESHFVNRFSWPLHVYRYFFDHGKDYLKANPSLTQQDYKLSEFHGERGLNASALADDLKSIGFQVELVEFHWEGMGLPGRLVSQSSLSRSLSRKGIAPVFRLIAKKGE